MTTTETAPHPATSRIASAGVSAVAVLTRGAVLVVALVLLALQAVIVLAGDVPPAVLVAATAISILPAALVALWFVDRDGASLPGRTLLAIAAGAGALAMLPAVVNPVAGLVVDTRHLAGAAILYAIAVPLLEESVKLGATRFGDRSTARGGLALGAAAGVGFTFTENLLAIAAAGFTGGDLLATGVARAPVASLHVVTGAVAAGVLYAHSDRAAVPRIALAIGSAAAIHGAYNLLAWAEITVAVPFVAPRPVAALFLALAVGAGYGLTTARGVRLRRRLRVRLAPGRGRASEH